MAQVVSRLDGTAMNSAGAVIEKVAGVEEEYFFEGTATRFRLSRGATEYPSDGRWEAEPAGQAPFRTRHARPAPA